MKALGNFFSLLLAGAAVVVAPATNAGEKQGAIQADWSIGSDGQLSFFLDGTGSVSCSTVGRWSFDATTPVGKAFMAAFLTAYSGGRTIFVAGKNECTRANAEVVTELHVE